MVSAKLWLGMAVVGILVLLLGACHPASLPLPTPPLTTPPSSGEQAEITPANDDNSEACIGDEEPDASDNLGEPVLSDALIRGCNTTRWPGGGFETVGLKEGEQAVNFKLKDIHGNEFVLSWLLAEKPVMMVFGSFT